MTTITILYNKDSLIYREYMNRNNEDVYTIPATALKGSLSPLKRNKTEHAFNKMTKMFDKEGTFAWTNYYEKTDIRSEGMKGRRFTIEQGKNGFDHWPSNRHYLRQNMMSAVLKKDYPLQKMKGEWKPPLYIPPE